MYFPSCMWNPAEPGMPHPAPAPTSTGRRRFEWNSAGPALSQATTAHIACSASDRLSTSNYLLLPCIPAYPGGRLTKLVASTVSLARASLAGDWLSIFTCLLLPCSLPLLQYSTHLVQLARVLVNCLPCCRLTGRSTVPHSLAAGA
jgi:hypothetical protein